MSDGVMRHQTYHYPFFAKLLPVPKTPDTVLVALDEETKEFVDPHQALFVELTVQAMSQDVADRIMQGVMEAYHA